MPFRSSLTPLVLVAALIFSGGAYVGSHGGLSKFGLPGTAGTTTAASEENISVHFSPGGGCTQTVVDEIDAARQTILVQSYSFTSRPISDALIEAQKRGVKVTVVFDKEDRQQPSAAMENVVAAGIPSYIDAKHSIAHNKIMLIDGRTIITGSFNFTKQAETSNAENLLVLHDMPNLFAAYEKNFTFHLGHSEPYSGNGAAAEEPKPSKSRRR